MKAMDADRDELLRQIDGLCSALLMVIQKAEVGKASRHQYADGKGSLAGVTVSCNELAHLRRLYIESIGQDPLDLVDVGPISDKDPL